jgi:hypothetical protein
MRFILEQMLDRGELRSEKHFESGRERFDCHFAAAECSLLDQIEDVPNDIQRYFLELVAQGKIDFSVADHRGLNIYWRVTERLNNDHADPDARILEVVLDRPTAD